MKDPRTVLITGASSGIGRALSIEYAAPGRMLAITGRDADRLGEVTNLCAAKGAGVRRAVIDVTDREAMGEWLLSVDRDHPVDLIVANAGISGGTAEGGESDAQVRRILAVNVDGVLNTIHPLIPKMIERGRGQVALMASLAAYRGFPGAPAYCASKAAVKVYGEALRGHLRRHGIEVAVICPGFVISRMTDANDYRMPFIMPADRAARIIRRGLERDRARIAFPRPTAFGAWLTSTLPSALVDWTLTRLPAKGPAPEA